MKNKSLRLDIGGPKGNAFYIFGNVRSLLGHDLKETAKEIIEEMMSGDYNNVLRIFNERFPMVELYADRELPGVDKENYTIDENPDIIEL